MHNRLFLALACVLLIVRLPSLVQPMGADQGLYAYVGDRILAGDLPYRDAWDQKPPAIHYTYAALRSLWPSDGVVALADLVIAAIVAALLYSLGGMLSGRTAGQVAALLFLLLSDPSFWRNGGAAVRAQCETFIAALVIGAFLLLARSRITLSASRLFAAGVLLGTAFVFKYNTGVYLGAAAVALWSWQKLTVRSLAAMAAGFVILPALVLAWFALHGAVADLHDATITYNVQYSGQTYGGPLQAIWYLLTFPVQHARVDSLWLLGGAGCAVLLAASLRDREWLPVPAFVAAACLSIAINGGRGLPQYFVQALPLLALAAAMAAARLWTRTTGLNLAVAAVVAFGVWRVSDFPKLVRNIGHDTSYAMGRIDRTTHLARYGDRDERKYSALAMSELADFIRARTTAEDRVYVFGFASGTYVAAQRASASRFFWSRPVIVNFNADKPGYGIAGLRTDLESNRPAIIALQKRDWAPDVQDSEPFFMTTPALRDYLLAGYAEVAGPAGFACWERR
jgi:4-amino-4-deoxy-L-arabinose transferase-like glycosyltransferase